MFIKNRTPAQIAEVGGAASPSEFRDPQTDLQRVKDPQWCVVRAGRWCDASQVARPELCTCAVPHAPTCPLRLIVLGVCTHLGCVPISNAGDYGGWYWCVAWERGR